jgi:serpin B
MIDRTTYLILTNAVYFKSDWKYQFNETATEDKIFYIEGGGNIQTPMMHMHDDTIGLNYSENADVQMLQLPYKGGELSMCILLPKDDDVGTLESNLNSDYLMSLMDDRSPEEVDVYLPKFKFEQKYELNDMLIDIGMPSAFDPETSNFTGIAADGHALSISKVIHQSFVEVNEQGTEAAAATAVVMVDFAAPGGGSSPQPIVFNANHPFIFFIQHEETGQILFMGKVGNPQASA